MPVVTTVLLVLRFMLLVAKRLRAMLLFVRGNCDIVVVVHDETIVVAANGANL